MLKLNNSFTIYLMDKDNNGQSLQMLNRDIINMLCNEFGGATVVDASGYWVEDDKTFKDDNIKVTCNYNQTNEDMRNVMREAIIMEYTQGEQLAVSIELNGTLYILESLEDVKELYL